MYCQVPLIIRQETDWQDFMYTYRNLPINPISLKWGLLRPRRDESVDNFQIGLT